MRALGEERHVGELSVLLEDIVGRIVSVTDRVATQVTAMRPAPLAANLKVMGSSKGCFRIPMDDNPLGILMWEDGVLEDKRSVSMPPRQSKRELD